MKYHIITIGKIKEKYLTAGIDEFLKRLRPYGRSSAIGMWHRNKTVLSGSAD